MARQIARIESADFSQDLAFGQIVVVVARWILVLAGLILTLWLPAPIGQLRFQIFFVLLLAMANFYLHTQLLMRRPTVATVAYLASAADMALITILIAIGGGFQSDLYIFYFPALLALSVAFPASISRSFAGAVIVAYSLACFGSLTLARDFTDGNLQVLLTRILMLAAVAVCGGMYWQIERSRRQAAVEAQQKLLAQIQSSAIAQAS